MENEKQNSSSEKWNLYFDTSVSVGLRWGTGLEIVIEREPTDSVFDAGLGHVEDLKKTGENNEGKSCFNKVARSLLIEEIPNFIAALNEIYKRHYQEAFEGIKMDEETITGDNDDRIATLQAYRVFADSLSDFAEKTGLLRESQ
jgi:hypothetical protein